MKRRYKDILRSSVSRSVWFGLSALAWFACASEGMQGSESEPERGFVEQADGEQILGNSGAEDTSDGPSTPSDGASLGTARQAITGASKVCRVGIAEGGDWIDTLVVNNSWTLEDCGRWGGQVGGNPGVLVFIALGCMTDTDFSFTNPQPFGCP
jgi:hypothetical protein